MTKVARVLIIEDNQANLELMIYLLDAFGYDTLNGHDGEEGLRIAMRDRPDLIVCDIQMPKVDGYDVARLIKADPALRDTPLVAVTAFAMVGDREKMLVAGFDGYLAKPIDPAGFVPQLETYLPPGLRSAGRRMSAETTLSPVRTGTGGRTILIVDNMQVHLDLASTILGSAGYTVIATQDSTQALALARQTWPDLIMSDVCMPVSNGYDFIAAVKADIGLQHIPFVFVTSTAMTERERAKGLALGAAKYLFRPIEPQVLLSEIEACLPSKGA
jgi:two-component system cell cycle response regulator